MAAFSTLGLFAMRIMQNAQIAQIMQIAHFAVSIGLA
jgi:hypothetical protein